MEMVCRLCTTSGKVCRSHLLPEFLYQPLYDEKHRFSILTAVEGKRYGQRGLNERLLCHVCEQHLCQYERYAADVMGGRLGHCFRKRGDHLTVEGIDYTRFKLFQLSILWRASVSKLEFFRLVSLGPHEERLRRMLLAGDPGRPEEFGCIVVFAHDNGHDLSDTFFNPEPRRWAGRRMYWFFFASAAWLYHCDRQPAASHLQKFFLRPEGTLTGIFGNWADGTTYGRLAKRVARRAGYA